MIIALDPGQHTGIAMRLDNGEWGTLLADKVPDPDDRLEMVLSTLRERMESGACKTVVVENYKTMGYLSKYGIETIELVGAIKTMCWAYTIPLIRQEPHQRLPFEREAKAMLKERSKLLKLPVSDHEVSALSHLLRYEYTQQTSTARSADASSTTPSESTSGTSPLTGGPIAFAVKPVRRSVQGGHDK